MYDRSSMNRAASYSYPVHPVQQPQPQKHYPTAHSTSSAFSASANPNEDWTKVSDLAERRRIQNRIAQRNYRKKLKKRLEDLERRAGSSSASPEQKHEQLAQPETIASDQATRQSRQRSASRHIARNRTPDVVPQHYMLPSEDRGMFGQNYTRELSTSPPPFSYAALPATAASGYSVYDQTYHSLPPTTTEGPFYSQYATMQPPCVPTMPTQPIVKLEYQDVYDDFQSPFSMGLASISAVDGSAYPYATPPLSDSFDHSQAGSPPDFETMYPQTPASLPSTPPQVYDAC